MRGVSLIELLIAIVIISILSTLSVEYFRINRERVLDGEVQSTLALILIAEKDFRRQQGNFFCSGSEAALNSNLVGILLPTLNMDWDYSTNCRNLPLAVCVEAQRSPAPGRRWRLCCNEQQAVLGSCGVGLANCPNTPCF